MRSNSITKTEFTSRRDMKCITEKKQPSSWRQPISFLSLMVAMLHRSIISVQAALQMSNIPCWTSLNCQSCKWKKACLFYNVDVEKSQNCKSTFLKMRSTFKQHSLPLPTPEWWALEFIGPEWVKWKKQTQILWGLVGTASRAVINTPIVLCK